MNINLHIERLVLDGLPLEARQGPQLQAAVERELTRLLGQSGALAPFGRGVALASVEAASIRIAGGSNASGLARQIAGAVYGGLRGGHE